MKKKYRTVRSVPKSNMKILKTEAKCIPLDPKTHIHDRFHF